MIQFWLIAAAMILVALSLTIFPLFRRNKRLTLGRKQQNVVFARQRLEELMAELIRGDLTREQYTQARAELEQSLYNDLDGLEQAAAQEAPRGRWAAAVMVIVFPLTAVWLYLTLGTPQAVTLVQKHNQLSDNANFSAPQTPASIEDIVKRLGDRLRSQPDDLEGWLMLARSYNVMGRHPEAAKVLAELYQRVGDEPNVMIQYATALAMSNGGNLEGKPNELINKTLLKQPGHPTGLWLAGMAAVQRGHYENALSHWRQLEPILQNDPEALQQLQELIGKAEQRLGIDRPEGSSTTAAVQDEKLRVRVTLDSALADQVDANDSLFIYAQALSGPQMPLAVVRKTSGDLPLQVVLNDSLAMIPAMKLSNFSQVRLGARISKSGNATPQSGDFQGEVEPVQVGSPDVINITITERLP